MKKFAVICLLGFSLNSFSAMLFLENCEYEYIPELGQSKYIGTYSSGMSDNIFSYTFDSYCPSTLNI